MTTIESAKYVTDALAELELVKSEASLTAWHESRMNTTEYLHLSQSDADKLEEGYRRKVARLTGMGAG